MCGQTAAFHNANRSGLLVVEIPHRPVDGLHPIYNVRPLVAGYTVFGLVAGLFGAAWFGWHFARPMPTGNYWPGWWYRGRQFSILGLRLYAAGGVLDSVGLAGVTFYPSIVPFVVGIAAMASGVLLQGVAVVACSRQGSLSEQPVSRPVPAGLHPRFGWRLALLLPCWVAALAVAGWLINQSFPAYGPPPQGGYAHAAATVEATDPANHNEVKYVYTVAGRTYQGAWFADGPDGDASQLRIGQTISIWYQVSDPNRSCDCRDPHDLQQTGSDSAPISLLAFFLISAAFGLVAVRMLFGRWEAIFDLIQVISSKNVAFNGAVPNDRGGSQP